jgi:hypothetical protein
LFSVWICTETSPPAASARAGWFLVDDPAGNMIRCEEEAIGYPQDFNLDRHTTRKSATLRICFR